MRNLHQSHTEEIDSREPQILRVQASVVINNEPFVRPRKRMIYALSAQQSKPLLHIYKKMMVLEIHDFALRS